MTAPAALGRRRRRGGAFRVPQLFANGEAGAWYDPSDLTAEKVAWRRNLLTWSEDFTNAAWTKNNITISANAAVAPDGTTTADKLIATATTSVHSMYNAVVTVVPGVAYTASVYVKAAEYNFVAVANNTTASYNASVCIDLTTGAQSNAGGTGTYTVTNAGNGWWKVSATVAATSANGYLEVHPRPTAGPANIAFLGDGTSGVLVWGAQLERGSTATAYQRITDFTSDFLAAFPNHTLFQDSAGTTPVTALGQPVGRVLDTSGRGNHAIQATSASRPLLDGRVNLLTFSEQFDNAAWTKNFATVTANAGVAPDGTTTADLLYHTSNTSPGCYVTQNPSLAASVWTMSFYAKASGKNVVWLYFMGGASYGIVYFDLSDATTQVVAGSVSSWTAATITAVGNGWFRCAATSTTAFAINNFGGFGVCDAKGSIAYTASGTNGVLLWGADLRLAADAAYPYQRVAAATDYADVGVPRSFLFDGFDDSLYTASNMDLSGTDKVTVLAGVRKLAATVGVVCETSPASFSNAGSFGFYPENAANSWSISVRGATNSRMVDATSYSPPATSVVSGNLDIARSLTLDAIAMRVNGTTGTVTPSDPNANLGGGNFGSYVLFIGRRNNASLPFNGKAYQLIVRGALTDAATLVQAERFVAQRTGITL